MTFFSAALALLLHLLPGVVPLRAQSSRKDDIVFNSRGIPLAGASIRVCSMPASGQPCSPLAQIFSDSALTQALANPTTTDGLGNYFFYAAPGKYMIEVSGPGISTKQIPNVILPNDPTAPTFNTVSSTGAINAFSLTLTGNLTVNGSTVVLGNLASGTLNLTNQSTPPGAASSGTVNLYTKTADKKLYYKDETGTETGPLGSGGGGGSPAGNNGDLQSKNGSALAASGLNDNGSTLAINRDQQSAGPNPWFDMRAFGATTSGASTTGSINSGTNLLSLGSAQDFANGQGIVVYGAGAATSLSTPGTPTVSPNTNNGATTWNYKVIAEDWHGGLTAASSAGTTTTGASSLGVQTITGATGVISSGVLTVTTSSAHGLQIGNDISLTGPFSGQVTIATVPSSTTFTVNVGQVSDAASFSGVSVTYRACNTSTFPAGTFSGTGTLRYWIYRSQGAGAYALAGVAIGLDPYFVDCGGSAPTPPSYVPSTPPASAQAGYLQTTISSGGGTTTLTLATNAGTNASGQSVLHDNAPALIAAMNAAVAQGGGTVYIPSCTGTCFWNFNGSTDMYDQVNTTGVYVTISANAYVAANQPWILTRNLKIEGMSKRNTAFMYPGGAEIGGNGYPLLYAKTLNGGVHFRNLDLLCNAPQCTDFFSDTDGSANGSAGVIFENVAFDNNANSSGTARNVVIKAGFDYLFRQVTCLAESGSTQLPAPCMDFTDSSSATESTSQMAGRVRFSDSYFSTSGFRVSAQPNGNYSQVAGYHFDGVLFESLQHSPFRIISNQLATDFSFSDVIIADQAVGLGTPIIDATGSVQLQNVRWAGGLAGNGGPLLIGPAVTDLTVTDSPTTNQGNTQYFRSGHGASFIGQLTEVDAHPMNVINGGRINYSLGVPGALVGAAVASGGSIPVGTHTYALVAVDYDNQETLPGPAISLNFTTGNQTLTASFPSAPSGTKGWNLYQDGFRAFFNGCTPPQALVGATSFTFTGGTCGNSAPGMNSAGSSFLSSSGVSTYQLRLNGNPLTATAGSSTVAATSRGLFVQGHLPTFDASNNLVDSGVSPTNVTDYFNRASGNLGSEPNSPWTIITGTFLLTGGAVGGNTTSNNYAAFTGVGFPNDDQTVSATWVKSGTPTLQSNTLTLRSSTTALTAYLCGPGNTGTALGISKLVAGSFTSLASQFATINSGDIISFNVTGTSLSCYVNGVLIVSATDSSITSGFPGLGAFQAYNANGANLQWKNWMASPGYVSLQRPQTWSQVQTFSPGIILGSDQVSNGPRALFSTFLPGALTSAWTGSTVSLDKAITITRVQVQAKTAPSGCSTNAIVRLTDGTTPINVTVSAAANDSGAITQNYAAGVSLTVSVQTAAAGCTTSPADANAVIQYKMQ